MKSLDQKRDEAMKRYISIKRAPQMDGGEMSAFKNGFDAATALYEEKLKIAEKALRGVLAVADRKTKEFDDARAALAKLKNFETTKEKG